MQINPPRVIKKTYVLQGGVHTHRDAEMTVYLYCGRTYDSSTLQKCTELLVLFDIETQRRTIISDEPPAKSYLEKIR